MKHKKLKIAVLISVIALFLVLVSLTVYAYFSTLAYVYTSDGDKEVAHLGMNLSLLFDKLDGSSNDNNNVNLNGTTLPFINPANGNKYVVDTTQTWGTAQNPYVISEIRHLQNLSALQDIGYFYKLNIKNNFDTNGDYIDGANDKPYFLVCTKEGTPTVINGTGIQIKPIGTDQYPFIGEIGGAIVKGTATVPVKDGLDTDTSAIFNIKIMSKRKMPDHGIFGYVSYLGDTPDDYNTAAGTFNGYVSTISDILMADVSLEVKTENFVDAVANWINTHIFAYSALGTSAKETVPHETHHIGILAGHVNYVDVTRISIYYSSDEIVCIDLNDQKTVLNDGEFDNNYFSSTGIIGYIYSMNPEYSGNTIKIGTGSNSTSVSMGNLGGGGAASGVNPGYVLAAEMYNLYSQYSKPPILTADKLPTYESSTDIGIMIYVSLDEDNKPVFMDEIGRKLTPVKATSAGYYDLNAQNNGWQYVQEGNNGSTTTIKLEDGPFFYCQTEINTFDADGNFKSAPVYYTTITGTQTYKLTNSGKEYEFTRLTGTKMTAEFALSVNAKNNNMYLYTAKDDKGNAICSQWYRSRLLLGYLGITEATGRYYFYDGVFTFALSNTRDMICEIWPKAGDTSTIPTILLAERWEVGKLPNDYTYKTFFVPVTGSTLDSKKAYILAYPTSSGDYYIMNMYSGSSNREYGFLSGDMFSTLIGDRDTGTTDDGKFFVDVGKTPAGQTYFDRYLFNYNAATKRLSSADMPNIYLGVRSFAGTSSDEMNTDGYQRPYSEQIKTNVVGDKVLGVVSHYIDYTYDVELSVNSDGWAVKFLKYAIRSFGWGWSSKTSDGYLYTDGSSFSLSSGPCRYQIYEVYTEIAPISPDDAPNGMVPADGTNKVNVPLSAMDYVLWPQTVTSGAATQTTTRYTLLNVADLGYDAATKKGTWRYANGQYLHEYTNSLKYMFAMTEGAKFGSVTSNVLGGDYDGGAGFVKATLGTDGAQTFIPMGCISFKVNKTPAADDPIKIRVIVAVPTSDVVGGLGYNEDYYFGLWQNSVASGQNQQFNFEKNGTIAKFELPRSQPLFNGQEATPSDTTGYNNPIQIQYDANRNGVIDSDEGTYYSTYFQGETVLVAYEFTVYEAGVYTMGTTQGPMQIVYFSADGVASMGRDGTGGAQLQGIDFVYDTYNYVSADKDKIVTVGNVPEQSSNTEDYNYYYESSCLLFFDNNTKHNNEFVKIFHEKIYIRRYIDTTITAVQKTALNFKVTEGTELSTLPTNRYVKLEEYAQKCDKINTMEDDIYE